jgi:F0F1-type ATP synthase membrane subunit b/b'
MLEKEIDRLEAAENKVSTRLAEIEQLKHEFDATGEEYEEVEEE